MTLPQQAAMIQVQSQQTESQAVINATLVNSVANILPQQQVNILYSNSSI